MDRHLIYATAFLRALATGMAGVLLGLHLAPQSQTAGRTVTRLTRQDHPAFGMLLPT